jgi:predicted adenine nucleotide alpha hydrolase (AANH) superfamily ATPase
MRVLLHTCCGPCASHAVEELRRLGHEVTLCFSNANLAPPEEYERRLAAARQLAAQMQAPLLVDPPDHDAWRAAVQGFEDAPEGGERCLRCFQYSLARVQALAVAQGFDAFTTSLTISPHKRSAAIFEIGRRLDPGRFLAVDFKKGNGFVRSTALAKAGGLYRQDYCGCEFSLAGRDARRAAKPVKS